MRAWILYACLYLTPTSMLAQSAPATLRCEGKPSVDCTNAVALYNSIATNAVLTSGLVAYATAILNTNPQTAYTNILNTQSVSSEGLSSLTNFLGSSCQGSSTEMCLMASQASSALTKAFQKLGADLTGEAPGLKKFVNAIQAVPLNSPLGQFQNYYGFGVLNTMVIDLNNLNGAVGDVAGVIAFLPPELQKKPVSSGVPSAARPNASVSRSPVASQKGPVPSKK